MIYCDKNQEYVPQDEQCYICVWYNQEEDSCKYKECIPGYIDKIEEIGNA